MCYAGCSKDPVLLNLQTTSLQADKTERLDPLLNVSAGPEAVQMCSPLAEVLLYNLVFRGAVPAVGSSGTASVRSFVLSPVVQGVQFCNP